ncbi:MAG TPA: FAD-dependent oxidoreductase, partial [Candidatus Binatia bacterium]|nr:FAD-dependent oxidoreductase [Candidatus Binatia bacterium]
MLAILLGLICATPASAVQEINVDVCVYAGTSGGVVAAVQAARMGKSVALVAQNNHLGGMTSSGLGWTDIGHVDNDSGDYIQGVSREFYNRIAQKYGLSGTKWTFEPHVAETVFNEMIQQVGVTVYTNEYLVSVTRQGAQIIAANMNNGN